MDQGRQAGGALGTAVVLPGQGSPFTAEQLKQLALDLLPGRSAEPLLVPGGYTVAVAGAAAPFVFALHSQGAVVLEGVLEGSSSHELDHAKQILEG